MKRKFALLIGNGQYTYLDALEKSTTDIRSVEQVLKNPYIGAFNEVQTLIDASVEAIRNAINTFFAGRLPDDTLLLYLSGHGAVSNQRRWFFACKETPKSEVDPELDLSSIADDFILRCIDHNQRHCRAKRQIIIIDACKAAAFGKKSSYVQPVGRLFSEPTGAGRVLLAATGSTEDAASGKPYFPTSVFTYYLVQGLITGAADRHNYGWITVDDLFIYVSKYLHEKNIHAQKPSRKNDIEQWGELVLANNPLLIQNPQDPDALYNKGYILQSLKRAEEARELFARVLVEYDKKLHHDPYHALLWWNKANTHFHLNQYVEALDAYEHTLQLAPDSPVALHNKGSVLCRLERYIEALTAYRAAAAFMPWKYKIRYNLGVTALKLEQSEEAFRELDIARRLAPHDPGILVHLSDVLSRIKENDKTQQFSYLYEKAKALQPPGNIGIAYNQWDIVENPEWHTEETTRILTTAHSLAPHTSSAWLTEGDALLAQGEKEAAIKAYEQAIEASKEALQRNPCDGLSWHSYGFAFVRLGEKHKALSAYEQALVFPPDEVTADSNGYFGTNGFLASVLLDKGVLLLSDGKIDDVFVAISQALNLALPLRFSITRKGRTYTPLNSSVWIDESQQSTKEKTDDILDSLKLGDNVVIFPKGHGPYNLISDIYRIAGDTKLVQREYQDAATLYEQAELFSPDEARIKQTLGDIYSQLKRHEEARNKYFEADILRYKKS